MRLLLDTHVYRRVVIGSPRLTAAARSVVESAEQTFVSAASIWEIGIKARLGKIEADADGLVAAIGQSGFMELPVRTVDVAAAARLPLHYSGRFDRLLVGQAITEPLRLLTDDAALAHYSDLVLMV